MAETNEFYIKIGADVDDAMNKLNRLSSQLSQLASNTQQSSSLINNSMGGVSKTLSSVFGAMGVALTTAGIASAIIGIGKASLKTAAELEQISVSFEVFTGDAKTAKDMLAELKAQALKSPMQFQDIAKGAQTLMQYGLTAQQVVPLTKMLGDVSGGNADRFQRLSLAFGQVNAAGRLMGQEARQMINAGFNPLKAISDSTGESMASLTKRMHDGGITVQDVAKAFMTATSEGGQFFGMADKQSKTLQGAFNKMSEGISFTLAKLGEDINKTFDISGATEHISMLVSKLAENFGSANGEMKKSAFWSESLKTLLTDLALILDITIKGVTKLGTVFEKVFGSKTLDDFSNWLDNATIKLVGFFGKDAKPLIDYVNNFGKENPNSNIIQRQMNNTGMKKLSDLEVWLKQFSDKSSKEGEDGQTKAEKNKIQRLIELNKEAAMRIGEIWLTGEEKKLLVLKNNYEVEIRDFIKYKQDYSNITKRYEAERAKIIDDSAKNRAASESKYFNDVLQGLTDTYERIEKAEISRISKLFSDLKNEVEGIEIAYPKSINDFAGDMFNNDFLSRLKTYGEAFYSATKDFNVNLATGFSEIAGNALVMGLSMADTFKSLGSMILSSLGDYLIKIGTAAIAAGTVGTILKTFFSGGAATVPELGIAGGMAAVAVGSAMKALSGKVSNSMSTNSGQSTNATKSNNVSSMASGASYQYGGASYSSQSIRLAVDLTGSITATQTGYQINKSLETTLRVTGR